MIYAYVKDNTIIEYPIYEGDIKLRFPNTSFPIPFLPPENYVPVKDTNPPEIRWYENVKESIPEFVNNEWIKTWIVIEATENEKQERINNESFSIRLYRNHLLSQSDWTQLEDIPEDISNKWKAYRQALRDITKQNNFPWEVTWPSTPE